MTNIAELLSPEQIEALASIKVTVPQLEVQHVDLPPVTTINGVDVDLRSDGRHDTTCADCGTPLSVEIKPEGVDLTVLTEKPRVAVCLPCGQARVEGKQGVVIYTTPDTKEDELDLTKFSKAQLGALAVEARDRMVAEKAEALPAKRDEALKANAEAEARDAALKAQDRAEQGKRKKWMAEFIVYEVVATGVRKGPRHVPALDFTEVNLDEEVPAKIRSPYNKALHVLGEPLLDKEGTTYRTLREVHKRLWERADVAYDMPKEGLAPEPKGDRLLAEIDPQADAKVKAFAQVMSLSIEEARERLVALNLV